MKEINFTRLLLLKTIFTIILLETTFAHDTPVHQYVVKQAYYFLENEKGPIPELRDRIGLSFVGPGNDNFPWETGYIGVAAMREDLEDPIWGYGGLFNGWTPTSTHFWDADNGDDVKTPIPLSPDAFNAYYKARTYLFGGHRILYQTKAFDPQLGKIILGYLYSYSSVIELYQTGRCFDEGYVDLDGTVYSWPPEEMYMNLESARKMAAMILGRVAHLLTDMSIPAHTHNDLHADGDGYEDWMGAHYLEGYYEPPYPDPIYWDAWNAARQGPLIDPYQAVITNDWTRQIRYLFYTGNQIADRFPSDDRNGDNNYSTNYNGDDYTILNLIQEITHPYNAGSVSPHEVNTYAFRYCIRAVAGLFYWFAKECDLIPPPPPVPPIISHFTQSPNPICKGSGGSVTAYLSQGNPSPTYTWTLLDGPPGFNIIDTTGNPCQVVYNNTDLLEPDEVTDALIRCTATNDGDSDIENYIVELVNECPGCPTLAFENAGSLIDENPLLITSLSNPGIDVTDYYLINTEIEPEGDEINFTIHEPQTEHTWLDQVELIEAKVKSDELVAVNDEGEIINYKIGLPPVTVILNGETDITEILAELDTLDISLSEGDVLTISREEFLFGDDDDGDMILGGEEPPVAKDRSSILIRLARDKNGEQGTNNDGDYSPIGSFFFRPNKSIIAKKLRNLPPGNLELVINKDLVLDYFALVKNIKTAITNSLTLLSANHIQSGEVKDLLLEIDQNYAEIYTGEIIDFIFQKGNIPAHKRRYILKSVGRYETDTSFTFNKLMSAEEISLIPKENKLYDNYPNPFNPSTQIKYTVKENGFVSLKVYDVLGNEVAELVNEEKSAGIYTINFNASYLSSGIYFYTISAKDFHHTKKMILIK